MNKPRLLREWYSLDLNSNLVKESREKNEGKLIISGIIQKANTLNQNKRVYPMEILQREMQNYAKTVADSRGVGELDHPESSVISLDNVSHVVREIWWNGNDVMGRVEVLPTPKGQTLAALIDSGIKIGISSRGIGSTERTNEGHDCVQPDFQIICFDIVSEPSTPNAFLALESKQIDFDPKRTFTRSDRIFRAANDILMRGKK